MKPHRHVGFTLIELLVVISIIALLIAILLPALKRARAVAQHMTCMSTLRQISIASLAYSQDHEDWVPPTRFAGYLIGRDHLQYNTWRGNLTPYLTGRGAKDDIWTLPLAERDRYNEIWHSIRCPAANDRQQIAGQDGYHLTYGMSTAGVTYAAGEGMQAINSPPGPFRRRVDATHSSTTMAYTDTIGTEYIYPESYLLSTSIFNLLLPPMHPDTTYSVALLDGHSGVMTYDEMFDPEGRHWDFITK